MMDWGNAGGPNECRHGYAEGIPCPECAEEHARRIDSANGFHAYARGWKDSAHKPRYDTLFSESGNHVVSGEYMSGWRAQRDAQNKAMSKARKRLGFAATILRDGA